MTNLFETLLFAIIQGITEWLPVSSSGHLVIAQELMGLKPPLIFDITLHIGTLIVVLAAFRNDIVKVLKAVVQLNFKSDEGKLAVFIAVGSIPTALIGLIFHDIFASLFYNLTAVGTALIITGTFLFVSECRKNNRTLTYLDSVLIGVAQGIAIVPGISRSGITITTALLRKVGKETAFTYSFLLSIPAIIGAAITESATLTPTNIDITTLLIGATTSTIVGYASLKTLKTIVIKEKLHRFAPYCWTIGTIILISKLLISPSPV